MSSKWIKDLNIKPETTKVIEGNEAQYWFKQKSMLMIFSKI